MMCVGFYLLLQSIVVTQNFGWGGGLYHLPVFGNAVPVTGGMILIPLMAGVGMIFFNARNLIGWALAVGSLAALIAGVIASLQFTVRNLSLFDMIVMLVLCMGGTGLFLRSLRDFSKQPDEEKSG